MNSDEAKISVLMPACNAEKYIGEAIASVLDQTMPDFEFIIINDGSTDRTGEIIRSFPDDRIIYIEQENRGLAAALNAGLQIARADYIARFDADDICYSKRLEEQFRFLTSNPQYFIVGSAADYVDEKGEFVFTWIPPAISNEDIRRLAKRACPFIHSSVLYKKDIIIQSGGYNDHAFTFEDHFLWRNALCKGKAFNIVRPLLKVRLNSCSVTIDEGWRTMGFHKIKRKALKEKSITSIEGTRLIEIIKKQDNRKIKEGAYYSLLSKKFLWNNYQPEKARENLKRVLSLNKFHFQSYIFFILSFFPKKMIKKMYTLLKNKPSASVSQH